MQIWPVVLHNLTTDKVVETGKGHYCISTIAIEMDEIRSSQRYAFVCCVEQKRQLREAALTIPLGGLP